MKSGDLCRTNAGAPSRYLDHGLGLWVSSQDNDLCISEVAPVVSEPTKQPVPSDEEVRAALVALRWAMADIGRLARLRQFPSPKE